jgi:hypothetical protein
MFTSAARLVYERQRAVVCILPVIHAPKKPFGSFEKNRGISPVPGFHFWLKSESLGLNGTQLQ